VFVLWVCVQTATVDVVTTGEGAILASVPSVGVGTANHCVGGNDRLKRCSGLCSLGRRGLSQLLCWRARQLRALLSPLFARSAWAQPATAVAETTGKGAVLAYDRLFGLGSDNDRFGGHEI
jgi:hypothetical protein